MPKAYTEHEQKIADASKAWRNFEWVSSDEFAQHEEDRHVIIASGSYTGRPPIPLQTQKDRAFRGYEEALERLRAYEREKHLKHMPEEDVKNFVEAKGHENKGRRRGGRAIALQKYIRRIQRQIDEVKEAPDSDFEKKPGAGRPPMSRAQKILHLQGLIKKAKDELAEVYEEMDDKDRIWHEMHDLKSDRRQLRLAMKDPDNLQSKRIWQRYEDPALIIEALKDVNALISRKEAQIKMIEAGMSVEKDSEQKDLDSPEKLEEYRRTLDQMIKEQTKIKHLEQKAAELGIDVSRLKDLIKD